MEIQVGDNFLCYKSVWMDGDPFNVAYTIGKIYHSDKSGNITDDGEDDRHSWGDPETKDYFIKLN